MRLTQPLLDDHRVIEIVLTALDESAAKIERGQIVRARFFLDAAEFLHGFCEANHQRREEGILFPAMIAHGFPMTTGPLAALLTEHEQARALSRALREAAEAVLGDVKSAWGSVSTGARAYAILMRRHVTKEERALFPMAESAIAAAQHDALRKELELASAEALSARATYAALAASLREEMCN